MWGKYWVIPFGDSIAEDHKGSKPTCLIKAMISHHFAQLSTYFFFIFVPKMTMRTAPSI